MTKWQADKRNLLSYLLLALILATVVYVRIRLLQIPLERDEGEYAYMGQLMLKGIAPYNNAYTMKLPGVSAAYAVFFTLFGATISSIHLELLLVSSISVYLTYRLALRLLGREAAIVACASQALLSLSYSVLGVFAHATHFVMVFALAGFLLLFHYLDRQRAGWLLFCGGCFGAAFLMKQHAALIGAFAGAYLALRSWQATRQLQQVVSRLALFTLGVAVPYLLVLAYVWREGAFANFWLWTVQYARAYVSEMTFSQGWSYFSSNAGMLLVAQLPLFLLAALGLIDLMVNRAIKTDRLFLYGFFAVTAAAVCPGWYFRPHYFVMILPAVSLLAGAAVHPAGPFLHWLPAGWGRQLGVTAALLIVGLHAYWREHDYYFFHTPRQVSRACYALSPFPDALPIARYLKEHTLPGDRIAVFGSEPQLFFYADRVSATKHIYMYGLMENQPFARQMQQELMNEIKTANPKYVVMVDVISSWFAVPSKAFDLLNWAENYTRQHYEVVGVADLIDYDTTVFTWDDEARSYHPVGKNVVVVLKRKDLAATETAGR
jgi:hypothetical protein